MTDTILPDIEPSIARCRVILSVVAIAAVFVDPVIAWWWPADALALRLDRVALGILCAHLLYSVAILNATLRQPGLHERLGAISTWADVFFGGVLAVFTHVTSSPFYAFFAFAVMAVGFRAKFRLTVVVTAISVGIYLSLLFVPTNQNATLFLVRAVYLGMFGYLIGYLGQQRLRVESASMALEVIEQRTRIARDLHDGCVQSLGGINLRLESCQQLLRRGLHQVVMAELAELQASVNQEHDQLRSYMRSLAGVEATEAPPVPEGDIRFSVAADFNGSAALVDEVLQILREGVSNIRRHSHAQSATVKVRSAASRLLITIDDDGVGFQNETEQPWSIASRVSGLGGFVRVTGDGRGAHLVISVAQA